MYRKTGVLLVLLLLLNLPLISALEIRNVQAQEITGSSALVRWETDEAADSTVWYGTSRESLHSTGDDAQVTEHAVPLSPLAPATAYLYRVESGEAGDDHGGAYYSFTTLPPDEDAPSLLVHLPEIIAGTRLEINGTTEAGASVGLYVDGAVTARVTAGSGGSFVFFPVLLEAQQSNSLRVTSTDAEGNVAEFTGVVFADTLLPQVTLESLPPWVETPEFVVKASFSEESTWEMLRDGRSVAEGSGSALEQEVHLEEGENTFLLAVHDRAGWTFQQEFSIALDTLSPTVTAEIERGTEYYEGREDSPLHGKTEPGAQVFLFIYKPKGFEFNPDFKKARAVVNASSTGEFTFEDVDFSRSVEDFSWEGLAPRQVPAGLQEIVIFPIEQVAQQQRSTTYVYLIAEDKTGKTGFWQSQVNVVSCYGGEIAFSVENLPEFLAPYRLVPQLLDDGRQEIQAVFKLNYLGGGVPQLTPDGKVIEEGAKVEQVRFEPACTQQMRDDDRFGLGCQLLPRSPAASFVSGNSAYVQWPLHGAADVSKRKKDFWNDFVHRQVVFPLKVEISYRERQADGKFGDRKVQTSCEDLGYFVDIPVESDELAAPLVAVGTIDALNATIDAVHQFREVVEKVYLVSAVSCTGSWLLRTGARWIRIATSKLEPYFSYIKPAREAGEKPKEAAAQSDPGKCPLDQSALYQKETLDDWKELYDTYDSSLKGQLRLPKEVEAAFSSSNSEEDIKKITLEERCPSTANAWNFEEFLDTAFRWSCDRAFCRAVPAGWTSTRDVDEIGTVILEQQQCAVTGRGVPLTRRENCQELVKANPLNVNAAADLEDAGTCWQNAEGELYYLDRNQNTNSVQTEKGLFVLSPLTKLFGDFSDILRKPLYAYQPSGSEDFVVARGETCKQVCTNPRKPGYGPDTTDGSKKGCYDETLVDGTPKLVGNNKQPLGEDSQGKKLLGNRYAAGYTQDCFIKGVDATTGVSDPSSDASGQPTFQQCVCTGEKEEQPSFPGVRNAVKEDQNGIAESWSYREDRKFEESRKTKGTYYPSIRYYSGRDFSGAFGQDYLFDYFQPEGEEEVHQVNPSSDIISAFQSVCLGNILKNARMLESILVGARNCLLEAQFTGQFDAGMCKVLFTQHVCGLAYKIFSYASSLSCSPLTFDEVGKEGSLGDVGVIAEEGFDAIPQAVDSSIKDLKEDYGNAQLNQYFQGGVQGLAQSACLAAFGVEFPLFSDDFLMDAASAIPVQSSVLLFPKERELSTYNPLKKTAVFNYNLGGIIIPGCKMRSWRVSLKCIGPEDLDRPGVDPSCGGAGCDCLNTINTGASYEAEKIRLIKSGGMLKGDGQYQDLGIESPVKLDTTYRYDHAVVELNLDPLERGNEDKCFDEGYRDGKFYFPLTEISTGTQLSCHADVASGRYLCPQLSELFGFGGAYLEPPFVTCYSQATDSWVDCTTPNLYTVNDEIKSRVHLQTDGKGQCLKRTVTGIPGLSGDLIRSIPENIPGPLTLPESLGIVREDWFGGAYSQVWVDAGVSASGCENPTTVSTPPSTQSAVQKAYAFLVESGTAAGTFKLKVPEGVTPQSGYALTGERYLAGPSSSATPPTTPPEFDFSTLNGVQFSLDGFDNFIISRVLGSIQPSSSPQQCVIRMGTSRDGTSFNSNARDVTVRYELLERDEGGGCQLPRFQVKPAGAGTTAVHTQQIRIQREKTALGSFHPNLLSGNYEILRAQALQVLERKGNDMEQALALYYTTASYVLQGQKEGNFKKYEAQIKNTLAAFFQRKLAGEQLPAWDPAAESSPEFQKVKTYLCEVDKEFGGTCGGAS